jgi:RNA polymerase sigma-70 factor (ECF subfamily)
MLTSTPAFEGPNPPVATAVGAREASPERRREFDDILSHALPRFRRIAARWLRNPEDAEDAVQDAMLLAFRNIARFDGRSQMLTWVTAILINAARMRVRRLSRRQALSLDHSPGNGQQTIAEMLADPAPTPDQILEQRQLRELVGTLTDSLPPSQRAAMQLLQSDDFSIREAAEELGVAQGTVKARLARGRAELTQRFHRATSALKSQTLSSRSKAWCKASDSGRRRDGTGCMAHLPQLAAVQGGCSWAGA